MQKGAHMNKHTEFSCGDFHGRCSNRACTPAGGTSTVFHFSDGYGRMTQQTVFDGVDLIFNDFHTKQGFGAEQTMSGYVELNHCLYGCYCGMFNGRYLEVGCRDFSLNDKAYAMTGSRFLLGGYFGISLRICVARASCSLRTFLGKDAPDLAEVFSSLLEIRPAVVIHNNSHIQHIFTELYDVPCSNQRLYYRLKTAELFLQLAEFASDRYVSAQPYCRGRCTGIVREIESLMLLDLSRQPDMEDICRRFHLSKTSLLKYFTAVFGETPAAHLRRRRMETAALLLLTTDRQINDIASAVGYQNPSKFASGFYRWYGAPPSAFRKGVYGAYGSDQLSVCS